MRRLTPEDEERKKAIFDGMSPRRQKHILKKEGYDKWDPFIEPKEPIDMRADKTKRTATDLARQFLQSCETEDYSNAFGQGVWDMCLGIVSDDQRYTGMYEFACWYRELLKKEGMK
ncbi:MAG: hypothetical protein JRI70_05040 [Deltaproteobacteria bacterium]|nr:hypothetical protein [Deltaproteobacteria bacterium]MBW2170814.1 hypothetical protein [Deltaproteobacteria bacterium]